jgi:regulatory protein
MAKTDQLGGRGARPKRLVTSEQQLLELGYAYVSRFAVTRARCRTYLADKVRAAVAEGAVRSDEGWRWVDAVLGRLESVGAINDARWAEGRALTLHRRGRALRVIARDLAQRGIGEEHAALAAEALAEAAGPEVDPDLVAAVTLARKRRLGPFGDPERAKERRARDMAALARAGFAFGLARKILEASDPDALLAECGLGR